MSRLLVVAGEASGDLHAARLLDRVRRTCDGVDAFGMGGDELAEAGMEVIAHSREVAVVGIAEVLRILPKARRIFRQLLAEVDARRPAVALLVDFPDFNLRLARQLKRRGVRVAYYVSPQVWAWRRGRVKTIASCVDRMLVLFPFEVDFYREHDVEVVHVGHPLVDEVPSLEQVWDSEADSAAPRRLALLPGSRHSELDALLPVMLEAARLMRDELGGLEVRVIKASTVDRERLDAHLEAVAVDVDVVTEGRFQAVAESHLALCASGTATLEVGLLTTPLVVLYKLHPWTYLMGRMLVELPSFSLVNLVLGEPVVPELLQSEATPRRAADEGLALLRDAAARERLRKGLARVRTALGAGGASQRAAEQLAGMLCPGEAA